VDGDMDDSGADDDYIHDDDVGDGYGDIGFGVNRDVNPDAMTS